MRSAGLEPASLPRFLGLVWFCRYLIKSCATSQLCDGKKQTVKDGDDTEQNSHDG